MKNLIIKIDEKAFNGNVNNLVQIIYVVLSTEVCCPNEK